LRQEGQRFAPSSRQGIRQPEARRGPGKDREDLSGVALSNVVFEDRNGRAEITTPKVSRAKKA
jgi:hypothetical protein